MKLRLRFIPLDGDLDLADPDLKRKYDRVAACRLPDRTVGFQVHSGTYDRLKTNLTSQGNEFESWGLRRLGALFALSVWIADEVPVGYLRPVVAELDVQTCPVCGQPAVEDEEDPENWWHSGFLARCHGTTREGGE